MSQIAEFFVVDRDRLPALVEAAKPKRKLLGKAKSTFPEALRANARELDGLEEWSGYYFIVLHAYLDENGVPLMDSEFDEVANALSELQGASTFIFTSAHKSYLPQLAPEAHNTEELRRYFEEFNECEVPDAGTAMQSALATLRRHIGGLDDSAALLLMVG